MRLLRPQPPSPRRRPASRRRPVLVATFGHRIAALSLVTLLQSPPPASAQHVDILEGAPSTTIYVEASYSQNDSRADCDWYASAEDYLATASRDRFAPDCTIELRVRGIINRDGALVFSRVVERAGELDHLVAALVLDSQGGDADAAISMAKLIRESDIFSRLPVVARIAEDYRSVCFSACVVLLSAADAKDLEFDIDDNPALPSRIGIHGPGQFDRRRGAYDSSATNTEILRVNRRLKDYFRSIGVAERFVDDMFAVPFDEIRLLSRAELIDYGLLPD